MNRLESSAFRPRHRHTPAQWARSALAAAALIAPLLLSTQAAAAGLREVADFGANPSGIKMFLYVPDRVAPTPPIVVGIHWCHGTAQDFYEGTQFASLADKYGFITIYPSAASSDGCWDVHSAASLSHEGGSDSKGIVSMVRYVLEKHQANGSRVYATGVSSGAMMTNVLLGAYPDIFRAGSAFAGVPFSCFAGAASWNSNCADGKVIKAGAQWGDAVRAAYPGYAGPRPRIQLWHGTADEILRFANFGEEVKLWTDVLGVNEKPTTTEKDVFQTGWARTRYADGSGRVWVEAVEEVGQPHNLKVMAADAVRFFGLDGGEWAAVDRTGGSGGGDAGAPETDAGPQRGRDASTDGRAETGASGASGKAGGARDASPGDAAFSVTSGRSGAYGGSTQSGMSGRSGASSGATSDDDHDATDASEDSAGERADAGGGCSWSVAGSTSSAARLIGLTWVVGALRRRRARNDGRRWG